ncbi:hypothetical protein FRC05_001635 [Tulasnella sp. 425]|nr:hypothetical protein FRC05_001635 [Tulasnella sp. 425]
MSACAKLRSSDSADIELLTAIFHDLKTDRDDNLTCGPAFMGILGVQHVLSEVLGLPIASSPEASGQESELDPGSQSFQDSGSDVDDETWSGEWDPESLYRWILDEIRILEPGSVTPRCEDILRRLEERLALSSDVGALPDVLSSLTDDGNPSVGLEEGDLDTAVPSNCPISFLPLELLRHIFHFAHSHRSQIRLPVTLSHVNSYFRSVTLGMGSLWTTIDDLLPIPIVKLYVARSGEEPLHFRMGPDRLAHLSPLRRDQHLDILSKESKRTRAIELYGFDSSVFSIWEELLDERKADFSSLVKLELVVSSRSRGMTQNAICPAWRCFPSLQDLWIQECRSRARTLLSPFPPSLRRLNLRRIGFEDLSKALQGLLNLNALSLDTCSFDFSEFQMRNRGGIPMTCLENLEVARMNMEDIMGLASHLDTPNLSSFSITCPFDVDLHLADFLIPFTKAHPRLCSLVVQEGKMTSEAWSSVLENSVHLNHLVIRASDLCDDDLHALGTATTAPNVTHLTLENELRLTTSVVEQVVRTHPHLVSVILRGWDSSNVSKEKAEAIAQLVPHVRIEGIGKLRDGCEGDGGNEEDDWDDSYSEGSDFSDDDGWLSGDEAVRAQSECSWKIGAFTYTSY